MPTKHTHKFMSITYSSSVIVYVCVVFVVVFVHLSCFLVACGLMQQKLPTTNYSTSRILCEIWRQIRCVWKSVACFGMLLKFYVRIGVGEYKSCIKYAEATFNGKEGGKRFDFREEFIRIHFLSIDQFDWSRELFGSVVLTQYRSSKTLINAQNMHTFNIRPMTFDFLHRLIPSHNPIVLMSFKKVKPT